MIQWHPIFAKLLRPVLQGHYDIETNVPVGDLPREADIIVLRRHSDTEPPFRHLWRHLNRWNILEFKGRSKSARVAHIDQLVEVGLGIHRHLEKTKRQPNVPRSQVSFWYLANHLGRRFLRDVKAMLGGLEPVDPGLWRWHILQRPLWLVSNSDIPVDAESLPVHVVSDESDTKTRQVADLITDQPEWWKDYGGHLATSHSKLWKEIKEMARKKGKREIDWSGVIEDEDSFKQLVEQAGTKRLVDEIGTKQVIDEIGEDRIIEMIGAALPPEKVEQIKRLLRSSK